MLGLNKPKNSLTGTMTLTQKRSQWQGGTEMARYGLTVKYSVFQWVMLTGDPTGIYGQGIRDPKEKRQWWARELLGQVL